MTQEVKHTPLPWKQNNVGDVVSGKTVILETYDNQDEANAAFIVRACNAHYALIEALEGLLKEMNGYGDEEHEAKAIAALKLAKGE